MRILHTADWHIGQTLNGWSRDHEHRGFLDQVHDLILAENVDEEQNDDRGNGVFGRDL
jgi:exonuclease SbcD